MYAESTKVLCEKIKHYLGHEGQVNEIKSLLNCEAFRYMYEIIKTLKTLFSIMSNLQTHYHFKLDFQNVE